MKINLIGSPLSPNLPAYKLAMVSDPMRDGRHFPDWRGYSSIRQHSSGVVTFASPKAGGQATAGHPNRYWDCKRFLGEDEVPAEGIPNS